MTDADPHARASGPVPPHTEREWKLRATQPLDVAAVDAVLRELGAPCRESTSHDHVDVYLDDDQGSLLAAGVGLRLRSSDAGHRLTTKARGVADGGLFTRREHEVAWPAATPPLAAAELPSALRDQVEPFVLGRVLQPFLRLHTHRDVRRIAGDGADGDGGDADDLCELAIDRVQAQAAGRAATFHEIEVEFAAGFDANERLVHALLRALPLQPAEDDKPSHAAQLLGLARPPAATAPPDGGAGVGDTVLRLAQLRLADLHAAEVAVRADGSADALHTMRVAVRRLRSIVRAFRDLWPQTDAERLGAALADLGHRLGDVRDLDVLLAALDDDARRVPEPLREPATALVRWIGELRAAANDALQTWLRSDARLQAQATLEGDLRALDCTTTVALARTADEVGKRVAWAAGRVRKLLTACPDELPFEPAHQLRIAAKRLRYVAEEFAAVASPAYADVLRRVADVQRALGAVCDHEVAQRRLLAWLQPATAAPGSADPAATAAVLGALAAQHAAGARKARKGARRALDRLDRKRVWRAFRGAATDTGDDAG